MQHTTIQLQQQQIEAQRLFPPKVPMSACVLALLLVLSVQQKSRSGLVSHSHGVNFVQQTKNFAAGQRVLPDRCDGKQHIFVDHLVTLAAELVHCWNNARVTYKRRPIFNRSVVGAQPNRFLSRR